MFKRIVPPFGDEQVGLSQTDGRYVLFPDNVSGTDDTLVDQRTGERTVISTAGIPAYCVAGYSGEEYGWRLQGPWVAAQCDGSREGLAPNNEQDEAVLDSLATGKQQIVRLPTQCADEFDGEGESGGSVCYLGPVGADWLQWDTCDWAGGCHNHLGLIPLNAHDTPDAPLAALPPTSTRTFLDFDSTKLTTRLCRSLVSLPGGPPAVDVWGNFVVPQTWGTFSGFYPTTSPLGSFALSPDRHALYLERCKTKLHMRLPWIPTVGNAHELIHYDAARKTISGIFLPSRHFFVARVPTALARLGPNRNEPSWALSDRELYLLDGQGLLFQTAAPTVALHSIQKR